MMEAVRTSETDYFYQTTRRNIPHDSRLQLSVALQQVFYFTVKTLQVVLKLDGCISNVK
jgi:hypothetical protein